MPNLTTAEWTWKIAFARAHDIAPDDLGDYCVQVMFCKNCHFSWVALLHQDMTLRQVHKIYCPRCLHNEDGPYEPPPLPYTVFFV